MTELSNTILSDYQVRKTGAQKAKFIEFMQKTFPDMKIERGGFGKNQNLILGDPRTAKVIVGAHYDTCAVLPFPNFITPKNPLFYLIYNLLLLLPMIVLIGVYLKTANSFFNIAGMIYAVALFVIMVMGKPNRHTANDNTSGVIALCELLSALTEEERAKCAIVFFDNEEKGLLGSGFYRSRHKKEMKDQLMINLDCISDGDYIMVIKNAVAKKHYGELVDGAFEATEGKEIIHTDSSGSIYPSDQSRFPMNVAIVALKKNKVLGYYLDKIHTKHDVNFDERNIDIISAGVKDIISKIE